MISAREWANMTPGARLDYLQQLENQEAEQQGREPCEIVSKNLGAYEYGSYYPDNNCIELNDDLLAASSPNECLNTYFHESRHAYQHSEITNPSPWGDPTLAKSWEDNFENYISPDEDFEGYENQPVEKDANDYADHRMSAFWAAQDESSAQAGSANAVAGDAKDQDFFEDIAEHGAW